jgi:predicted membrane protein
MSAAERSHPPCIHCGSPNVLPFEDDAPYKGDDTLFLVILSAMLVITGYILFVLSTYLMFPIVVFLAIILITRIINKHHRERKVEVTKEHDYVCLDCGKFFKS